MSKTIELPDEVYDAVDRAARLAGKSPADFVAVSLRERFASLDADDGAAARRRVNGFLLRRIGDMVCAGNLVERCEANERKYWRVPVWVSTPDRGHVQEIGELCVDAETREAIEDESYCEELRMRARAAFSA